MTRRQSRGLFILFLSAFLSGCGRLKPVNLIDPPVEVRKPHTVVFFIDGLCKPVFRDMLTGGELPNIDRYIISRGVRVEHAVTTCPSITYAVTTTFITGRLPSHHGIVGNHYFDRNDLIFADFNTILTYRDPDKLYTDPTVFEILDNTYSVTIQQAIRRGATRKIDNWASSGIRWYFNQLEEIDCLVAERFYLISSEAKKTHRWPELIWAYFPATDEIGHRFGPKSQRYRKCLKNVDEQIGRICAALDASHLLDDSYLTLITDHSMVDCPRDNYINIASILTDQFHLDVATSGPDYRTDKSKREKAFAPYDAVLVNGGYRRANLHLRNGTGWNKLARPDQIKPIAEAFSEYPAVALTAYRSENGVAVQNSLGCAIIDKACSDMDLPVDQRQYRYRLIDGEDPLGYATDSRAGRLCDGRYHPGRDWLTATCKSEYLDAPVQIAEQFESIRSGDLMIFAAAGWDFSKENIGGHGSVIAEDMSVPMAFAGPGIAPGSAIETARTADVAVTLVDIMAREKLSKYRFDGKSLLTELKNAKPCRFVADN